MSKVIAFRIPNEDVDFWYKAKGNRSWREIIDEALFGLQRPEFVSYDEMVAYVDKVISELKLKAD